MQYVCQQSDIVVMAYPLIAPVSTPLVKYFCRNG